MDFDASKDFTAIVDGLEQATLVRSLGGRVVLDGVRRLEMASGAELSANGPSGSREQKWDIAWHEDEVLPLLGDQLLTEDGECQSIIQIQYDRATGRVRCTTVAMHSGKRWLVKIQQAIWQDLGAGPEVVDWVDVEPLSPAGVLEEATQVDLQATPESSAQRATLLMETDLGLDENYRVVTDQGDVWQVEHFTKPSFPGEFARVELQRVSPES